MSLEQRSGHHNWRCFPVVKTMSWISGMNYVQRHRCCFLRHQGLEEGAFSTHAVSPLPARITMTLRYNLS